MKLNNVDEKEKKYDLLHELIYLSDYELCTQIIRWSSVKFHFGEMRCELWFVSVVFVGRRKKHKRHSLDASTYNIYLVHSLYFIFSFSYSLSCILLPAFQPLCIQNAALACHYVKEKQIYFLCFFFVQRILVLFVVFAKNVFVQSLKFLWKKVEREHEILVCQHEWWNWIKSDEVKNFGKENHKCREKERKWNSRIVHHLCDR